MSKKILRKIINTDLAPKPIGPYNHAVIIDNTIYLSGVAGVDPKTNKLVEGGTVAETNQALLNMKQVLSVANSKMSNVVKITVLLADIGDFVGVNKVYKEYFQEPYPARTAFQAAKLPLGAKIEIEAIAMVGEIADCGC